MNLDRTIKLSSPMKKPFKVIDSRYGFFVSDWDTYEEANKAATGRPYSKVMTAATDTLVDPK